MADNSGEAWHGPRVPEGILSSQPVLLGWLGSFWSEVFEDREFAGHLQGARSLRLAQLYLDVMEAASLVDRESAPVFHRERWTPIRLRRSDRNRAAPGFVRIGMESAVVGRQTDEVYAGEVFTIGGLDVSLSGMTAFPAPEGAVSARCIVDSISRPSAVLRRGVDFDVVNGTLLVRSEFDPFSDGSPFPLFSEGDDGAASRGGDGDEAVLWACDTEVDRGFVYSHTGYAVGLETASTEAMKRVVNAVWDAVVEGSTPRSLSALVSAICGVPVALHDGETVRSVVAAPDGTYIVTDRESYRLPRGSRPADGVSEGSVLERYQQLDGRFRVYPYVTDPGKLPECLPYGHRFKVDVPSVDIPPSLLAADVSGGFSVGWDERDVETCGEDANGNPRLRFRLDGSDDDNDAFWSRVWDGYERSGRSMEGLFGGSGKVVPAEFFLRNLVGANTVVVAIDSTGLDAGAPLFDPRFFRALRSCMPDHVRVFFIEHVSPGLSGGGGETYGLEPPSVDEAAWLSVSASVGDSASLDASSGFRARDRLSAVRLVPSCSVDGGCA